MKNIPLLVITIIGTLVLIVALGIVFSKSSTEVEEVDQAQLAGSARLAIGPESAPVTIVEFSDFQCEYCAIAAPAVKQVLAQNPDNVRFIYRHFPLMSIHQHAQLAAQASEASLEFNKFWEMHDLLFARQADWSKMQDKQAVKDLFIGFAVELGIDKDQFTAKIDSDPIKQVVLEDISLGNNIKVDSTPTFFVNGRKTAPGELQQAVTDILSSN